MIINMTGGGGAKINGDAEECFADEGFGEIKAGNFVEFSEISEYDPLFTKTETAESSIYYSNALSDVCYKDDNVVYFAYVNPSDNGIYLAGISNYNNQITVFTNDLIKSVYDTITSIKIVKIRVDMIGILYSTKNSTATPRSALYFMTCWLDEPSVLIEHTQVASGYYSLRQTEYSNIVVLENTYAVITHFRSTGNGAANVSYLELSTIEISSDGTLTDIETSKDVVSNFTFIPSSALYNDTLIALDDNNVIAFALPNASGQTSPNVAAIRITLNDGHYTANAVAANNICKCKQWASFILMNDNTIVALSDNNKAAASATTASLQVLRKNTNGTLSKVGSSKNTAITSSSGTNYYHLVKINHRKFAVIMTSVVDNNSSLIEYFDMISQGIHSYGFNMLYGDFDPDPDGDPQYTGGVTFANGKACRLTDNSIFCIENLKNSNKATISVINLIRSVRNSIDGEANGIAKTDEDTNTLTVKVYFPK